jgi:nitroreductase
MNALSHQGVPVGNRSDPPLDAGDWLAAVGAAGVAPSIHHTQPWRFVVHPDGLELHLDPARGLPVLDPAGRESRISCGAALLSVRVALRASGVDPLVTLLPVRRHPTLLAIVRAGGRRAATQEVLMLHQAITRRHGYRHPFGPGRVPQVALSSIVYAAGVEGGYLRLVPDPPTAGAVTELIRRAQRLQRQDDASRRELTRVGDDPGSTAGSPGGADVCSPLGVLMSATDTELDQLRCGQALQRALLTATGHGVGAVILSAPTELPIVRAALRRLAGCTMSPQLVLQFGAALPAVSVLRRPATEFAELRTDPLDR